MGSLSSILEKLNERYIANHIGIPHDEARMSYRLDSNTVRDIDEFTRLVGDYYSHHFTRCIAHGGSLSTTEAQGRAKEIIQQIYRASHGSDFIGAFNDAHDGTHGGLRVILDKIAEHLKAESIERHVREIFDQEVKPNSWEDKVDVIRQFIRQCGPDLSRSLDTSSPERYATNYVDLIRTYVEALRKTSTIFRRL